MTTYETIKLNNLEEIQDRAIEGLNYTSREIAFYSSTAS